MEVWIFCLRVRNAICIQRLPLCWSMSYDSIPVALMRSKFAVPRQHCDDYHIRARRSGSVLPWERRRGLRVCLDAAWKCHQRQHLPSPRCASLSATQSKWQGTLNRIHVGIGFMEKRPRMRETLTNNAVYMDDVMGGYTIEDNIFIDVVCCHTYPESTRCLPACVPACLSAYPPVRPSACPPARLPACPPACPPACLPACVRACVSSVGMYAA